MNTSHITFAELDRLNGIPLLSAAKEEEFPLPAWYRSIYQIPLCELGVEDICKACRQNIHLEYVVPIALTQLQADVLDGELYDGELLVSLRFVPPTFWSQYVDQRVVLSNILRHSFDRLPDAIVSDAKALLQVVT
jgi:hypothetical protein